MFPGGEKEHLRGWGDDRRDRHHQGARWGLVSFLFVVHFSYEPEAHNTFRNVHTRMSMFPRDHTPSQQMHLWSSREFINIPS